MESKRSGNNNLNETVDINCDMGEGLRTDEAVMPYISSANIACGYHAGDVGTMEKTIELCLKYNVSIGAHPSFLDKKNFGRTELYLSEQEIYELVTQQLFLLNEIVTDYDAAIRHVKPHGALYNMSAKDKLIAKAVANAVKDFNKDLILYGLSGSHSVAAAKAIGLEAMNEAFADRTYNDDGTLTSRSTSHAVIEDAGKAVQQALQMLKAKTVTTVSHTVLPIIADTICIHGDNKNAVAIAKQVHDSLNKEGVYIRRTQ